MGEEKKEEARRILEDAKMQIAAAFHASA